MWFVWFLCQGEQILEGKCCFLTGNFWRYCHITSVSMTKQNKTKILWSATYVSQSFPWREPVSLESWDQSNGKLPARKKNCRKLHPFYFIWGNGQTARRNKGKMEVALKDKWLENLHIWKNKPVCFVFFAYTSCICTSYGSVLHWKK